MIGRQVAQAAHEFFGAFDFVVIPNRLYSVSLAGPMVPLHVWSTLNFFRLRASKLSECCPKPPGGAPPHGFPQRAPIRAEAMFQ